MQMSGRTILTNSENDTTSSSGSEVGQHATLAYNNPWGVMGSPQPIPLRTGALEHMQGSVSEPRNYAPVTFGRSVMAKPPPRFVLSSDHRTPPQTGAQSYFSSGHSTPQRGAVFPADQALASSVIRQIWNNGIPHSTLLTDLTATPSGLPSFETAMSPQFYPFVEGGKLAKPLNNGVVKLQNVCEMLTGCQTRSNERVQIPFAAQRSEVIAFLGRNSRILNDFDEPVHIIMDRVTSKTMDVYVEFQTLEDAMKAVEKHDTVYMTQGRAPRIGERQVSIELSGQASLMKDLFPHAFGIVWDGVKPEFKPVNEDEPWENFKGFVSEEEMIMLVKHVEVPHRVSTIW